MRTTSRLAILPAALLTTWLGASSFAGAQTATQPNVNPAQQSPGASTPRTVGGIPLTNPAVVPQTTPVNPAQTVPGAPNINPAQPVPTPPANSTNSTNPGTTLPRATPGASQVNPAQPVPSAPSSPSPR